MQVLYLQLPQNVRARQTTAYEIDTANSGPGGRRCKSFRPDHSFQGVISDSWAFIHTTVDKIVDGQIFDIKHVALTKKVLEGCTTTAIT